MQGFFVYCVGCPDSYQDGCSSWEFGQTYEVFKTS